MRSNRRYFDAYSLKTISRLSLVFLAIVGTIKLAPQAIYAVGAMLILSFFSNKREHVFSGMMLLLALTIMNGVIVDKGFSFYLVTRGVLFVMAGILSVQSGAERNAWFLSPFYILIGYVLYMMLASLQGWAPLISELKAILFLAFLIAFLSLVSFVNVKLMDVRYLRNCMLVVAGFYILGSIAVIPFPSIGKSMLKAKIEAYGGVFSADLVASRRLFNGLTWHSQTLGPLMAMMNAFLLSDYLCSIRKKSWLYRILLLGIPVLIYLTSSRTALGAYLVSILASVFFYYRERGVTFAKRQKVVGYLVISVVLLGVLMLLLPSFRLRVDAFVRKSGDVETFDRSVSLSDDILGSRMGLVESGLANFKDSPLFGNGFQVSKEMERRYSSDTGLILSAPVEKGVLPIMVLEEGGVIGACIMFFFVVSVYAKYMKLKLHIFLSCFTTMLVLNSGEAVFFSTSGAGGILWSICFVALAIDVGRRSHELAESQITIMSRRTYGPVPFQV